MFASRTCRNPGLDAKIKQMALPLAPLVSLTEGDVHEGFPRTIVNYWLLVEEQLDELAHFYHQRTPGVYTHRYPKTMNWRAGLTLEEKRRKLGKFIGLRGCDTPLVLKSEDEIREDARKARNEEENELWRSKMQWY